MPRSTDTAGGGGGLLGLLSGLALVVAPLNVPAFGATSIAAGHQRLGDTAGRLGPDAPMGLHAAPTS